MKDIFDDDYRKPEEEVTRLRKKLREVGSQLVNLICDWENDQHRIQRLKNENKELRLLTKQRTTSVDTKSDMLSYL